MEKKNEVTSYIRNVSLLLLGILFLTYPLIFTTATSDAFGLPKYLLLIFVVLVTLVLSGISMISEKVVVVRKTPFDTALFLLAVFAIASAFFAVNRADSLINVVPFIMSIILYFLIVNSAKNDASCLFLISCFVGGTTIASVLATLTFFKIYALPFTFTHQQTFTSFGSLLEQAMYMAFTLPIAIYFVWLLVGKMKKLQETGIGFTLATVAIALGLGVTIYSLLFVQKPILLPYETGFQTGFAAISQDAGRTIQGFLLGSGFGTYSTDFTRFKQPQFNQNDSLWAVTFFRSSSLALELLATTGILGIGTYIFLVYLILKEARFLRGLKENAIYGGLLLAIIFTFLLPLAYITQTAFFILVGLFSATRGLHQHGQQKFYDIELEFVALKKGIINASSVLPDTHRPTQKQLSKILPLSMFVLFLLFAAGLGYYVVRYTLSDLTFQKSTISAQKNNALETYNSQIAAIQQFPYRDRFYIVYSQTNLAIANSLLSQQPQNASPSAQLQQTVVTLIQQAINGARSATTLSPATSLNWDNLAQIYRALIGVGQDADRFAILSAQQAAVLDPNNPQEYVNLGGIFYQLQQWDNAQRQFQIAISLKPDYANAYYNLGHTLENKNDLQGALAQYQTVKTLVTKDKTALKRIEEEIATLQEKIGAAPASQTASNISPSEGEQSLELATPAAQLPRQRQQVEIPAPPKTASSSANEK